MPHRLRALRKLAKHFAIRQMRATLSIAMEVISIEHPNSITTGSFLVASLLGCIAISIAIRLALQTKGQEDRKSDSWFPLLAWLLAPVAVAAGYTFCHYRQANTSRSEHARQLASQLRLELCATEQPYLDHV